MFKIKPVDRSHYHICPACNGDGSVDCEPGTPYCDEDALISCPMCRTLGVVDDNQYNALITDGYPETKRADEVNPYDAS